MELAPAFVDPRAAAAEGWDSCPDPGTRENTDRGTHEHAGCPEPLERAPAFVDPRAAAAKGWDSYPDPGTREDTGIPTNALGPATR